MKKEILLVFIFLTLFLSGCQNKTADYVREICITECREAVQNQKLFSQCLLESIPGTDYVCDIAHNPRLPIDNLPQNQCQYFLNGNATHFVELTPECEFIRAV